MTTGIFFTIFISWSIAILSTWQFFIYLNNRNNINPRWRAIVFSFSLFWFFSSLTWWLGGFADFFVISHESARSEMLHIIMQVLVGFTMMALWLYLSFRFFSKYLRWIVFSVFSVLILAFEVTIFIYGIEAAAPTFFSIQFVLHSYSRILFAILGTPAFLLVFIDFIRVLLGWKVEKGSKTFLLLIVVSLFMLGIGGSVEQLGIVAAWLIPLARIIVLIGAMLGFMAIINAPKKKRELTALTI
ncbi:hypothetical protein ACFL3E_00175 [Patescibacteria group bacterium]